MRELQEKEVDAIGGGSFSMAPISMVNAAASAMSTGVCDYNHMNDSVYCYNDLVGPDFSVEYK
ncbi:MAG TPA: hypothetical protein VK035_10790 [Kiloniellales bacterium]|nr:hypothetical protein [Kiloniellales bacterium]